ncbi:MAG: metallopeptidase family protein [Candidatus Aminicenantes bacterium]|nr:metallopeptidase family protein [Candidatus Aminicenantes bacterium]
MERERFEALVEDALKKLPSRFRRALHNIAVMVEDRPPRGRNLLGIYQGVPLDRRGSWYGNVPPDVIVIYQQPIEQLSRSDEDVKEKVLTVVLHEIGHYFGLDEKTLADIERDLDY